MFLITAVILSNSPVFWAAMGVGIAGLGLLAASGKNLWQWLTKNRVDRLEMYVDLTNDLQSEIKRLREERDAERADFAAQVKAVAVTLEECKMQIEALTKKNESLQAQVDAFHPEPPSSGAK